MGTAHLNKEAVSRPPEYEQPPTQPVNLNDHERRITAMRSVHLYAEGDNQTVSSEVRLVLQALREADPQVPPYIREVTYIQSKSHAYNAQVLMHVENGDMWEVGVFSSDEELKKYLSYLKMVWNVDSEEKIDKRLLIRQLALVVASPGVTKDDILSTVTWYINRRYDAARKEK